VTLYSKKHTLNVKGFGGQNAELWFVILDYNARHCQIGFQLLRQPDVSRKVLYVKTLRFDHRVTRRQNSENGNFSYRCRNLKSRKVQSCNVASQCCEKLFSLALSAHLPHGTTKLPLDVFSWNFTPKAFIKIFRKYSILDKSEQKHLAFGTKS